jgi:soluble lytic murein transglycosylase
MAVIRQESVFAPHVASPVGALGLMQLMPATARELARDRDLGLELDGRSLGQSDLLKPVLNIALGSAYLARMRDRFGHAALATAAYNAGPHRVARWLPDVCTASDLWIAAIPFEETRSYVERVLAYRVIYGARLGLPPVRMAELLPPIPGGARGGTQVASGPRGS